MSMIADKIGIKKPSLYKHFSSKDEIVDAMYQFLREQSKKNANIKPVDFSQLFQGKTAYEVLQGVVQGLMIIIMCTCITTAYRIPCRFPKQIMLYHSQREKAVKLLLTSKFG